ncbi:reverse transcriptase domain-containing protein [Tanacetum coccineum]
MPYTMYEKLGLGEPKATRMSLELADRSIQYPRGIVENVLIKVDKFVLLIDFVILDMPKDSRVLIILGRPFLATARAMIYMFNKKITLRVGDDELIFDMEQSIKRSPTEDDECYRVDDLDNAINAEAQELLANDTTDLFLLRGLEKSIEQSNLKSFECEATDSNSIRHMEAVNMPYSVAQETVEPNKVEREQLYSTSANEIDEKKPELKILPQHLEYKMSDIKGISPSYCMHMILMEDDYKPVIQPQRRLNPKVQDVVKNEIVKLLDSGLIYLISDSSWVSPIHMVPKKGGMTIGFFKISIAPEDQEKTTFPCPYGTFAYRRMPFGLCNAPATFQRCMMAIFHDMVEDFMEVFMEDFSVFGNSFDCCLANLDKMLARCEETNLVLNWEKCHFMVKEGIVLGHKISGAGIEVDRDKFDVIAKLPYPTNVKGVRSFLGHAGFYRRIKKEAENLVADHLSILENPDLGTSTEEEITNKFPDEHLMILKTKLNEDEPWHADYVNYIVGKIVPPN